MQHVSDQHYRRPGMGSLIRYAAVFTDWRRLCLLTALLYGVATLAAADTHESGVTPAPVLGDFNGDGKDDVLLRHTDGRWFYYPMDGRNHITDQRGYADLTRNLDWQFAGIGDLNGDGRDDVLMRHTDGRWWYYPMDGRRHITAERGLAGLTRNLDWHVAGMGDLNGDGKDDVLLRNKNGRWYYYPMNGRRFLADERGYADLTRDLDWQFAGIGDLNGDGKDDVLLRHTDGRWDYYPMDGRNPIADQRGLAGLTRNLAWRVAGMGDLNGDGKDDVLLRHTDSRWYYYPMDGRRFLTDARGYAGLTRNLAWQVAGIGDLNGDGRDDVLLRHTDSRWYYYPMDGRNYLADERGYANLTRNPDWSHPDSKRPVLTGRGVTVAILDRGIDWDHPDFIRPDGTTRIRWILDMTGQNGCDANNPGLAPVEYSASQINDALAGGAGIDSRDAVGHGTVTAGIAAGNGSAFAGGKYAGLAPEADLIVVKITSEGAPAHDGEPAEAAFNGCINTALDWLETKMNLLGQPTVALINSGTQFGPIDGTSAVSRKIDAVFGSNRPGRVYVAAAGDEGGLPNHSGADYDDTGDTVISLIKKSGSEPSYLYMWYTGTLGADVSVEFADGARVGPVGPGENLDESGVTIVQYDPGQEFYRWQSTSGDRAVWIRIQGHEGPGSVRVRAIEPGSGYFDLYGDLSGANLTSTMTFSDHLVSGRLNDYSSTNSAIVVGAHVARHQYTDIDGIVRDFSYEGLTGDLYFQSSGGPTRDGRLGVDITAAGHNVFAALAQNSYWATGRSNMIQDSGGWYIRGGATSGAAPVVVGAVALMLELKPDLTADQVRAILRDTAVTDAATGTIPNLDWGYGKLNLSGAIEVLRRGAK